MRLGRAFKYSEQTGSAHAVVKQFAAERLEFPGRHAMGPSEAVVFTRVTLTKLLCKQEVAGSIPAGSTNERPGKRAFWDFGVGATPS